MSDTTQQNEEEMKYEVSIVNVFTHEKTPTLGNPAGVVTSTSMLSQPEMKEVGIVAQQPITSFLSPVADSETEYDIRYYDLGGRECHICGHATLAATAQLVRMNPSLDGKDIVFHLNPDLFEGKKENITTHVRGKELSIDLFPSKLRYETEPALYKKVADVLNVQPSDIDTVAFSVNIRDYVVALKDSNVLLQMKPDFKAMKSMAEEGPYMHEGLMVTCKAPAEDEKYDIYDRVFLPITGVNEDIACGSGNCSIIPFWHDHKGLNCESKRYNALFPFPEGKKGFVGGVQIVEYSPEEQRITIAAQTVYNKTITVEHNRSQRLGSKLQANAL